MKIRFINKNNLAFCALGAATALIISKWSEIKEAHEMALAAVREERMRRGKE